MSCAEPTVGDRVAVNKHIEANYKLSCCQVLKAPVGTAMWRPIVIHTHVKSIRLHHIDNPKASGE